MAETVSSLGWRRATLADARALWTWRNDPATRAASFSDGEVPFEEHCAWLERRLADPGTRLFILVDAAGRGVGQMRFDSAPEGLVVSIALDPSVRGRGYGRDALQRLGADVLAAAGTRLVAYVKAGNAASLAAFRGAGFVDEARIDVDGQPAVRLVRGKEETCG